MQTPDRSQYGDMISVRELTMRAERIGMTTASRGKNK